MFRKKDISEKGIYNQGFTLVELIVVVTILAILATIGFVSYSSYLTGVRDTNRISQLRSLSDGLNLYSTRNNLPTPEDSVDVSVTVGGQNYLIASQGYAGANILESVSFEKGGKDPKDNTYFTYMLTNDRRSFQLMTFLEESFTPNAGIFQESHAVNFEDRIPLTDGRNLGALTDASNTPIQEVSAITSVGEILLDGSGDSYTAQLNNEESLTGNDSTILYGAYVELAGRGNTSCKEILASHPYTQGTDGRYWIDTLSEDVKIPCDMTSEGGGWTLVLHATDNDIEKYDSRGNGKWGSGDNLINFISEENSFKFPDNVINTIRSGGDYMLVGDNQTDPVNTYFAPSTCLYDHDTIVSGSCETVFNDIAFTNTSGIATSDTTGSSKGIAVWSPGIITHYNAGNAACYQSAAGGCTNSSNQVSVKMYVR